MKAGWQKKKLGEVIQLEYGKPLEPTDRNPNGLYPAYGANGEKARTDKYYRDRPSIIVGRKGSAGEITLTEEKFWPLDVTYYVEYNLQQYDLQFLYYLLTTLDLPSLAKGVKPGINRNEVYELPVNVPLLPVQQRIVGILDEAFDGIATAKANAEKNLQNARALFESHLQSVFDDAWDSGELVTLADLATDITDGDHMPPPKASSGVPFITIGNVAKDTRTIDFSDTFMVSRDYFDRLKYHKKPMKGDVLYTVTGSFGIPVLISEHREFCFQRHIGLIRPKSDVSSEWLYYLLMSPQVFKQANDGATGTAQKTVSLKLLRGFQVPKVPMERQQSVVSILNALTAETQNLESIYQQKLAALDALKKSLLDQAFSGEL
jgi:type I restriction enzyme S subunit